MEVSNEELIKKAESVLNPHYAKDRLFGDVGAAIVSENGNLYTGVCLDIAGVGICAERNAISSMVTDKEYKFKKVVAVWRDERDGKLYVLPPCGICRQFMQYVDETNLEAEVVLGKNESKKLSELLPNHEWPEPLEGQST